MTKAQLKRRLKKCYAFINRIGLKNRNFTIFSNNCWGGMIYDDYSLEYKTPTIGLWMLPKDYIKFLSNLDFYLNSNLKQISYLEFHGKDLLVKRKEEGRYSFELDDMIIGRLIDVDIVFLHYASFEDAKQKWDRRKKRVNFSNMLVKLNDQNDFTDEDYNAFQKLDYKHKLFFTANPKYKDEKNTIFFRQYVEQGYVVNDTRRRDVRLNIKKYLNSMLDD